MYIFEDKNKEMIALRPENTAGVVRAFISNNMQCSHSNPLNLFYHGPMFRYERHSFLHLFRTIVFFSLFFSYYQKKIVLTN